MFGLPRETDLTFLVNLELLQVCVGLHQVVLRFDNDTSISLECEYEVNGKARDVVELITLLGHRITVPVHGEGGQITLRFSEGSVVVFRDSNIDYESYQITAPGKHLIV